MHYSYLLVYLFFLGSCKPVTKDFDIPSNKSGVHLIVLGTVQDAGSPQIGCKKSCCFTLWENPDPARKVVSLGIVDFDSNKSYLIEASPDIKEQVATMNSYAGFESDKMPDGIFITHAHIGHYTGLMQMGREALGGKSIPVYAMPRFLDFIKNNGPWSQLVKLDNIRLNPLSKDSTLQINERLAITPILVPHRDEFSETVGFRLEGKKRSVLFIPDIDKWEIWERSIVDEVDKVDVAYLDATFYDVNELPGRNMSEIPHPFVVETMQLFDQDETNKRKIHFIHLNHTNPLLDKNQHVFSLVKKKGYQIAQFLDFIEL